MIEVFKTNVRSAQEANVLAELIEKTFDHYHVNFDLEDCDRILRVKTTDHQMNPSDIIKLLKVFGVYAEVLPDEVSPQSHPKTPALNQFTRSLM
jgi:hypothetical protein